MSKTPTDGSDNDAIPCIRYGEITVPRTVVPDDLWRDYENTQHMIAGMPNCPGRNALKGRLNQLVKTILAEAAPRLLFRSSPRAFGAKGFFESLANR